MSRSRFFSPLVERALRLATVAHHEQCRKDTTVPYITHPVQVAWILQQAGLAEESLLAAALLHDVVEDAGVTVEELREQFPQRVVDAVLAVTEHKHDAGGAKRPWEDRKRDHLAEIATASFDARALTLADKLHNLLTIQLELAEGADVWKRFNAPRERLIWYYREMVERAAGHDERLSPLADACRDVIAALEREQAGL